MGMSSSQARLLTLTGRLHDIERKAQRTQARKLRLVEDSSRVYNTYIRALDATKLQYKTLMSDGTVTYRDASMNTMQNGIVSGYSGEHSTQNVFLQGRDGKVWLTPTVASHYGLTESGTALGLDDFVKGVTHKDKKEVPVYKTVPYEDPSIIESFTPIRNQSYSYAPIDSTMGSPVEKPLNEYASFDDTHKTEIVGATALGTGPILAGGNYTISTKEELLRLMTNNDSSKTRGTKFTLMDNIDLTGEDWKGIKDFNGIFDGNGYTISNLTGSCGLFKETDKASIMNIKLENVDISSTSQDRGALIGYALNTNVQNVTASGSIQGPKVVGGLIGLIQTNVAGTYTINNVSSTVKVNSTGDYAGGLFGWVQAQYGSDLNISNAYAQAEVTGSNYVGGIAGYMMYDQNTSGSKTDIQNVLADCTVRCNAATVGDYCLGGFFGKFEYKGDKGDYCYLTELFTKSIVDASGPNVGPMGGQVIINMSGSYADEAQKYINLLDCGSSTGDINNLFGTVQNNSGNDASLYVKVQNSVILPSFANDGSGAGAYISNIMGVFTKSGLFDAGETTSKSPTEINNMRIKVAQFLSTFADDQTGNTELWYLNQAICDYLQIGKDPELAQALYDDVMSGTSETSSWCSGSALPVTVRRGTDFSSDWTPQTSDTVTPWVVNIPSINTIADEIYYYMKSNGYEADQATVKAWFNDKYGALTDTDKITLANINDRIAKNSVQNALFMAIENDDYYSDYTNFSSSMNPWTINVSSTDQTVEHTCKSGTKEEFDHYDYIWDTSDKDIADAMLMWALAQRGIHIVSDAQASSYTYLRNVIDMGEAILTSFGTGGVGALEGMASIDVKNLSDDKYNQIVGIVNTSVAVNVSVIEVADESERARAEAKYEADLKDINKKEARLDAELASFDRERKAVERQIETSRKIAEENVQLTFKLYS